MILVLDNIRSKENVGSIFRTADAFGVTKIYLCGVTPAPIDRFGRVNTGVAKAALGAEKYIAWESKPDTGELIRELKKGHFTIAALEQAPHSKPLNYIKDRTGLVLVLGEEVHGLTEEVLKECETIYEIPMLGKKESLNVSVATGIALYALSTSL